MVMLRALPLLLGVIVQATRGPQNPDYITSLPGLATPAPFNQYAGYLTVNETGGRNEFYWFVESQGNPETDPLVVWLQGGPGCSSLIGLFTENGPWRVQADQTVELSPLSWNRLANVLYIEAPAGVGFSYSKAQSGYNTGDAQTAADNLAALQQFYKKFPSFSNHELYLTGESYAGNYVPQLVDQILTNGPKVKANLKGFMVGNPVINCSPQPRMGPLDMNTQQIQLFYWHGMIPYSSYQNWMTGECHDSGFPGFPVGDEASSALPNKHAGTNPKSGACAKLFSDITAGIGYIDPDNRYTDTCTGNATLFDSVSISPGCTTIQASRTTYLNSQQVQVAINAIPEGGKTRIWAGCASPASSPLNYTSEWPSMIPLYNKFFEETSLRILVYSGDVDIATVPHAFTQYCLSTLQRELVEPWRPWKVNGRKAGYIERFDKYTYATVKGAGHEVPMFQPYNAFQLFQRFISGEVAPSNSPSNPILIQ